MLVTTAAIIHPALVEETETMCEQKSSEPRGHAKVSPSSRPLPSGTDPDELERVQGGYTATKHRPPPAKTPAEPAP